MKTKDLKTRIQVLNMFENNWDEHEWGWWKLMPVDFISRFGNGEFSNDVWRIRVKLDHEINDMDKMMNVKIVIMKNVYILEWIVWHFVASESFSKTYMENA